MKAIDQIMDAIDIETYIVCKNENEGKILSLKLGQELNLDGIDIMYQEFDGYGMRVRLRKYIFKPAAHYKWLEDGNE